MPDFLMPVRRVMSMLVDLSGCNGYVEFSDNFLCPETDVIFLAATSKSFWQFAIHGIELGQVSEKFSAQLVIATN
uniref:AraC family transcriptional regulator n=1 Tax=Steinernema glaseri TaxID=37863 RepID=A0A1I7YEK0_9BILA